MKHRLHGRRRRRPHGRLPRVTEGVLTALLIGAVAILAVLVPHRGAAVPAISTVAPRAIGSGPTPTSTPPVVHSATHPVADVTDSTTTITIRPGDTLWALARRYGTTIAELQSLNGLGASTLIYAGQTLRVPTGPTTATSTTVTPDRAATAVAYARAQLGKPYEWGGTGPYGFDCSGLVMRAWGAAGVELPRTTYEQADFGTHIARDELQPGDLVFSNDLGHVQLYIGDGMVIEAPHTGAVVRIVPLPVAGLVDLYVRVYTPPATSTTVTTMSASTAAHATTSGSSTSSTSKSPSSSSPPPTSTSGSSTGGSTTGARGIYAFSGGNTSTLATDPDLAGTSLVYYWAQIEPQQGVYRWDIIDKDMAPWIASGKKVILRVSTSGWASWDTSADSAHGTPAWVYAQGVKFVTERDGAVLPQYWNPTFVTDLTTFLHAFAARYDGNPHVALIDAAVGIGGETKVDSEKNANMLALWQAIGYTDTGWWTAVQQILSAYTSSFTKTPVAVMPDKTFIGGTPGYDENRLVTYAVSKGLWLQDNGLIPNRTLPAPWGRTPIVSEQRGPTSQTGDTLAADLNAAIGDHATMILIFTSDITGANSAALHQAAIELGTGTVTGSPAASAPKPAPTTAGSATAKTSTRKAGKAKPKTTKHRNV